jgi:hypothetical protein
MAQNLEGVQKSGSLLSRILFFENPMFLPGALQCLGVTQLSRVTCLCLCTFLFDLIMLLAPLSLLMKFVAF